VLPHDVVEVLLREAAVDVLPHNRFHAVLVVADVVPHTLAATLHAVRADVVPPHEVKKVLFLPRRERDKGQVPQQHAG
jgi:hypothetical protein